MGNWDTPAKDIPRQLVMKKRRVQTARPRAVRTALTLPGPEMLCVLQGLRAGLFNQNTHHVFAEKDAGVQRRIMYRLNQTTGLSEVVLWRDNVYCMPLRSLLSNQPLEFAYLDFCGAVNDRLANWLVTEFAPSLADGATVAVTLSRTRHKGKFMSWWHKQRTHQDIAAVYQGLEDMFHLSKSVGELGDVDDILQQYDDSLVQRDGRFRSSGRFHGRWKSRFMPHYHESSVKVLSAFTALFPYHDFDVEMCMEYRRTPRLNSTPMVTCVFTNFQRRESSRLPKKLLHGICERCCPPVRAI